MYICSTEEVVTDKGCGHRLPPWLVFSWTPFRPLTPTRHPSPEACSAPRVPVCCPAPLPTPACAAPARSKAGSSWASLPGDGDDQLCFGFAACANIGPCAWILLRPELTRNHEQRTRVLLPPCHGSSGCFQASPLSSPSPVLCLCVCGVAVPPLAGFRLRVAFWGNPSHKAGPRGAVLVLIHSRLKGRPARQVCFHHHGLTPHLLWH